MLTRRALLSLPAALALAPAVARAEDRSIGTFPVAVFVADEGGTPVASPAWIDAQLARAGLLYQQLGIHFQRVSLTPIDGAHAHLVTRANRDALAKLRQDRAINVFVVASLKDVDEKDTFRRGVHWRPAASPGKRFIIVSKVAGPTVLAHELGHYFGNPHTTTLNNLMSYARKGGDVFLNPAQIARTKATARSILRSGEVKAL